MNCLNKPASKDMYVQCSLEKRIGTASYHRTIWANADKAIEGNVVKVEEDDGSWTTDWIVKKVHGEPIPKEFAQHQSHAHTRQRKCSDI